MFCFLFWRFTELHYSQTMSPVCAPQSLVLEIYRITLLSNVSAASSIDFVGFGDLQNYTTLKRCQCLRGDHLCFGDLQNYTTLKPSLPHKGQIARFGDLQNYTTLKRWRNESRTYACFGDLQNYTTLKLKMLVNN